MATSEHVQKLYDVCKQAVTTPISNLVRNPDWGKINFDAAERDLERLFWLYSLLLELPVELIPDSDIGNLTNAAISGEKFIGQIRQFSIEGNQNPSATRDTLVGQIKDAADEFTRAANNWIPFLAYQKGDVQRNITLLSGAVTEADALLLDAKKDVTKKQEEIDEIIRAAKEAAATVGVAHFTENFAQEATDADTQASTWLKWTAGFAVATVGVSFIFAFIPVPDDASQGRLVQLFSSKFVILALLITATIWCGRLYKGSKHLAAMNKHRANALKTFQAFVRATNEEQIRDAVLLETTRSIFAITPTGYLDGADGGAEGPLKVMEVIRGASRFSEGNK